MRGDFGPDLLEAHLGGVPCLSPLLLHVGSRQSFAYNRLPPHPIKLSILKLDGSSFEVEVGRMASVGELKAAVEEVISQAPEEGRFKISWSHVWGHFCLCFEGQRLVDDKAFIRHFGIRDGDKLRFVHHQSVNYKPFKRRLRRSRSLDFEGSS